MDSMFESLRRGLARALPSARSLLRKCVPGLCLGLLAGLGGAGAGFATLGEPVVADDRPAAAPALELPEPIVLSPEAQELSTRYRGVFWTLATGDA